MTRRFLIVMLAGMMLATAGEVVAQTTPAPYSIKAVIIKKYDRMSNSFSEEISETETMTFLNELDLSFFGVVEVAGAAEGYAPGRRIQIIATEGGKTVKLRKETDIGVINSSGRYFVPFWIDGPLCSDLKIEVRIFGQARKAPVAVRKLKFACGE